MDRRIFIGRLYYRFTDSQSSTHWDLNLWTKAWTGCTINENLFTVTLVTIFIAHTWTVWLVDVTWFTIILCINHVFGQITKKYNKDLIQTLDVLSFLYGNTCVMVVKDSHRLICIYGKWATRKHQMHLSCINARSNKTPNWCKHEIVIGNCAANCGELSSQSICPL